MTSQAVAKAVPKDPLIASLTGIVIMVCGALDLATRLGITSDQLVIVVGSLGAIVGCVRQLWLKPDQRDPVIAAVTGAILAVLGAFHLGERFALNPDDVATVVGAILSGITGLRFRHLTARAKENA